MRDSLHSDLSSSSSSSSLILVSVVSLLLGSVALLLFGPTNSYSYWFCSSSSYCSPPSSFSSSAAAADGIQGGGGVAPANLNAGPLELQAGLQGVSEEAISNPSPSFNSSFSPLLANYSNQLPQQGEVEAANNSHSKIIEGPSKFKRIEASLARARASIREAAKNGSGLSSPLQDPDYVPQGPIYRHACEFHRSYLEMERVFKIFVYEEGEPPLFHDGPCRAIYSSEGRFIHDMETGNQFRTRNPDEAHVHFLPFSVVKLIHYLYVPNSFNLNPVKNTVIDYVNVIASKYPYWNRSLGADHFMLSCHDWGPETSASIPLLYKNSIRVLCNANSSEGFDPSKDASLPEINLRTGDIEGLLGGPSPSRRIVLGFFAGGMHGPIRPVLLEHWKNKDEDLRVYEYLPKGISYNDMMRSSKFCICPSGYEVASPRIVEAIYAECVPVIISDHYILPFSDVLNWKSFSVQVPVSDIPNLKNILMSISQTQYIRMQRRVKQVQRHFVVNSSPKRYDVFHMIIHSVWLRRLNKRIIDYDGSH